MVERGAVATVVTYSILIDSLCKAGKVEAAHRILQVMDTNGVTPDVVTFNILLNGLCKAGKVDDAYKIFETMQGKGVMQI
ncbi:hypothetical protein O6H91_Y200500 [Diphasiastrum complanatum]|nr:hypothetical protein O6H91_Y200500 [Diphasiastrum complanatum]